MTPDNVDRNVSSSLLPHFYPVPCTKVVGEEQVANERTAQDLPFAGSRRPQKEAAFRKHTCSWKASPQAGARCSSGCFADSLK